MKFLSVRARIQRPFIATARIAIVKHVWAVACVALTTPRGIRTDANDDNTIVPFYCRGKMTCR
jgi:hypothetical protein